MNIGEVAQESVALTWEEKLLRTEAHCKTKLLFKKILLKWYLIYHFGQFTPKGTKNLEPQLTPRFMNPQETFLI